MRKVIFRGKSDPDGEWLYGDLYHCGDYTCIGTDVIEDAPWDEFIVDPETVGMLTDAKTRNGGDIYEGDIISWYQVDMRGDGHQCRGVVIYNQASGQFEICRDHLTYDGRVLLQTLIRPSYDRGMINPSVVGNRYDNPEMLTLVMDKLRELEATWD